MKFQRPLVDDPNSTLFNSQVTDRLDAARREFEEWRQSRTNRSRIPDNLWILAAELARECGALRTSRELHLNYCALRNRMNSAGSKMVRRRSARADFVELMPTPIIHFSECTVEIDRGKGARIRIHLKSPEAPDLSAIGNAFLMARR